jgi:hypothetical protein
MAESGTQDSSKCIAISPDQKDQQDRNDGSHRQPAGFKQKVDQVNVHNDGSKQSQPEGDKASDEQEKAANNLEYSDDVKVMAQEKGFGEVSSQCWRWWRHRNEMQKDVRTEYDENQSEKNPSNNGGDFHWHNLTLLIRNSNVEISGGLARWDGTSNGLPAVNIRRLAKFATMNPSFGGPSFIVSNSSPIEN